MEGAGPAVGVLVQDVVFTVSFTININRDEVKCVMWTKDVTTVGDHVIRKYTAYVERILFVGSDNAVSSRPHRQLL